MTTPIHHFFAQSDGVRAYLRLNGYPVFGTEPSHPKQSGEDVSMWVMPGVNRLEVSTAIVPETSPADASFEAVLKTADRQNLDTARVVWELHWPPPDIGDLVPFYRVFDLVLDSPSQLWNRAEVIDPNEETMAQLRDLARRSHAVFSSGDHATLGDMLEFKGRDIGLVLGMTEEQGIASQQKFLKAIMSREGFAAIPFNDDDLNIRFIANGTVAWIANGTQPLLLSNKRQGMDLFAAKLDGVWTIVR